MKKAELKQFLSVTERMLLDNGFKRTVVSDNAGRYEWIKYTKFGRLLVDPDNQTGKIYSIFCRFDDEWMAIDVLRMFDGNLWSGKCNFHSSDYDTIIHNFDHFLATIKD
jgi:hypothetical protein